MSVMRREREEGGNPGISLLNPDSWHHWRAQIHLSASWQRVIKTEFAETLVPSLFFEWRFTINSLQRLCRKHINKSHCNGGICSKCKCNKVAPKKLSSNWLVWNHQPEYSKARRECHDKEMLLNCIMQYLEEREREGRKLLVPGLSFTNSFYTFWNSQNIPVCSL